MKFFVCLAVAGILVTSCLGKKTCTEHTECGCGEVCAYKRQGPCTTGQSGCKCIRGCVLADQFFKPRESRRVYCNECSCNTDSQRGSQVWCTRRAWCDLPNDYPLYPDQPACRDDQLLPLR